MITPDTSSDYDHYDDGDDGATAAGGDEPEYFVHAVDLIGELRQAGDPRAKSGRRAVAASLGPCRQLTTRF